MLNTNNTINPILINLIIGSGLSIEEFASPKIPNKKTEDIIEKK